MIQSNTTADNGYIQFTYVRVPRAHVNNLATEEADHRSFLFPQMLMKHTQVSREGIVTDPPLAQLTYGALLSGRIAMVADSSNTAKKVSSWRYRHPYPADRCNLAVPIGVDHRFAICRCSKAILSRQEPGMILRPRIAEPWLTVMLKLETQLIDYPIHQRRLIVGGFSTLR